MFQFRAVGHNVKEYHPMQMRRPQGLYEFYLLIYTKSPYTLTDCQPPVFCRPGSLILFPPYAPQNWDTHPTRMVHSYCTFTVDDPDYFKNLRIDVNFPYFLNIKKETESFFSQLDYEFYHPLIGKKYMLDSLINGFFVNLSRKLHAAEPEKNIYELSLLEKFEDIRIKIFEDPSHDIPYYASDTGFSVRRFEYYYRYFFEVSPKDHLTTARLLTAKDKLAAGLSTADTAEFLGFKSEEYFRKWFYAHTGMSPRKFQKNTN